MNVADLFDVAAASWLDHVRRRCRKACRSAAAALQAAPEVAVGEDAGTLEDVNEPYLIMQGYLKRTSQGRVAMPLAYKKLGIAAPKRDGELFG